MSEPMTNPTSQATSGPGPSTEDSALSRAARRITGTRQLDHNHECVGCGAHYADPCHLTCPFETGDFSPPVLLRAAARRLRDSPAGVGYDIGGALFAAAVDLVGRAEVGGATDEAREILTGFLVDEWGEQAEQIRAEVVYRHSLFTDLDNIALSLYAAAARHDGLDFDPDAFGDFLA